MRRAISSALVAVLAVGILVGGILVVYAFPILAANLRSPSTTTVLQTTTASTSSPAGISLAIVSGSLTVSSGENGTLAISIRNTAAAPITQITIVADTEDGGLVGEFQAQNGAQGGTATAGGSPAQIFAGSLSMGQSVNALGQMQGAAAGTTYTFTISLSFQGSANPIAETLSLTART